MDTYTTHQLLNKPAQQAKKENTGWTCETQGLETNWPGAEPLFEHVYTPVVKQPVGFPLKGARVLVTPVFGPNMRNVFESWGAQKLWLASKGNQKETVARQGPPEFSEKLTRIPVKTGPDPAAAGCTEAAHRCTSPAPAPPATLWPPPLWMRHRLEPRPPVVRLRLLK